MYNVFTTATGTIGSYPSIDKAVSAAKKLNFTAYIFRDDNPFKPIKTIFARK